MCFRCIFIIISFHPTLFYMSSIYHQVLLTSLSCAFLDAFEFVFLSSNAFLDVFDIFLEFRHPFEFNVFSEYLWHLVRMGFLSNKHFSECFLSFLRVWTHFPSNSFLDISNAFSRVYYIQCFSEVFDVSSVWVPFSFNVFLDVSDVFSRVATFNVFLNVSDISSNYFLFPSEVFVSFLDIFDVFSRVVTFNYFLNVSDVSSIWFLFHPMLS